MRTFAGSLFAAVVAVLAIGRLSPQGIRTVTAHTIAPADYERWKKELSNWGRWGKDDQIGALNLITPAKRKQAATLVKQGFSVSMAGDADTVKAVVARTIKGCGCPTLARNVFEWHRKSPKPEELRQLLQELEAA